MYTSAIMESHIAKTMEDEMGTGITVHSGSWGLVFPQIRGSTRILLLRGLLVPPLFMEAAML